MYSTLNLEYSPSRRRRANEELTVAKLLSIEEAYRLTREILQGTNLWWFQQRFEHFVPNFSCTTQHLMLRHRQNPIIPVYYTCRLSY